MRREWTAAWLVYLALTAAGVAQLAVVGLSDRLALHEFTALGPATERHALLVSLGAMWLLAGWALWLLARGRIDRSNLLLHGAFLLAALVYANLLREHVQFGDVWDYVRAAEQVHGGADLHERYLYPPMWASLLSLVHGIGGRQAVLLTCFGVNTISLWAFFWLAVGVLRRCGLTTNLAAALVLLGTLVNVPILRNLFYVQVNLLLLDLILAAALLFSRYPIWSGIALALGGHLKVAPLLLAPLFVHRRRWTWTFAFVTALGVVLAWTGFGSGFHYYEQFFENLRSWTELARRSSSLHTFVSLTAQHLTGSPESGAVVSTVLRGVLAPTACLLAFLAVKRSSFVRTADAWSDRVLNGAIPLLFLPIIVSKTVWVYHLTLLLVPALILLTTLRRPRPLCLFATGYALTFVLPTFDIYPWSFARMVGWLILYGLVAAVILGGWRAGWTTIVGRELDRLVERLAGAHGKAERDPA